jgi:hypothetical protein
MAMSPFGGVSAEQFQGVPPGIDREQFVRDAAKYALLSDWSCVRGPPSGNQLLPGLRYGASLEIRPELVLLPCPCAGGTRAPPQANDEGALGAGGLWTAWMPRTAKPRPKTEFGAAVEEDSASSFFAAALTPPGLQPPRGRSSFMGA